MNILVINSYQLLPIKNAGQKGIVLFAEALSKKAKVFIATTKNNPQHHNYSFQLLKVFSSQFWIKYTNIFYFFKLLQIVKKNKISHLIFEQPYLPFIFILFRIFTSCKCIYYSRNIEYVRFKSYHKPVWIALFFLEYLYCKGSHLNFFVSPDDMLFAIKKFHLKAKKCIYMPHALEIKNIPEDIYSCKKIIREKYHILENEHLLFFNGSLNYPPNTKALEKIIHFIIPLLNKKNIAFKILICGSNLPLEFNCFKEHKEIIYASFVEDIALYNKGIDIFINPVIEGGGVKVKLLEALSYNLNCISTASGAKGISIEVCKEKLFIAEDNNWNQFVDAIIESFSQKKATISQDFYNLYYVNNISNRAYEILSDKHF